MKERLILITKQLPLFMKLNTYCNDHGWMVYNTTDPEEVLAFVKHRHVAGIIWDLAVASSTITLPLIKKIRTIFNRPIITLATTKNFEYEMQLFALHIDDYVTQPYEYEEIIIRMQQCLWSRTIQTSHNPPKLIHQSVITTEEPASHPKSETESLSHSSPKHFQLDNLVLDIDHYRVLKDNENLGLTPKEFKLLFYLIKNKNQVLSREQLLRGVWNYGNDLGTSRIVDIHISHLRDKIEPDPHHPKYVKTVRGFGYTFEGHKLKVIEKRATKKSN
ncbi:DNA-binding response regulator [Ligilactobacillus sp. LYQ139]|uniref:response regulator transcription factor n=1 Tax=Ligilactobacillus sp. LYQ139 TaxID=3378800 RepID=UPI003851B1B7